MDQKVYWIWLQAAIGYASDKVRNIVEIFGDARNFYEVGAAEREQSRLFTSSMLKQINETGIEKAMQILDKCNELGYSVIAYTDEQYPERLRNIIDPPAVLYVKGSMPDFDSRLSITVVGTRNASEHGYRMGRIISQRLGWAGAIIVSGCAQGIDTSAHIGCLEGNGITAAVLGCAIDYRYNMQNAQLREQIAEKGSLISEYPPGVGPQKHYFPQRNRIMSGLSCATIAVEGSVRSGALITAGFAIEQGRDLFVIPGNADDPNMMGVNSLLRDGAVPVLCAFDVLENYIMSYGDQIDLKDSEEPFYSSELKKNKPKRKKEIPVLSESEGEYSVSDEKTEEIQTPPLLSENAAKLFRVMKVGEAQHINVLSAKAGLTASQALSALTELEMEGIIISMPGKRYSR